MSTRRGLFALARRALSTQGVSVGQSPPAAAAALFGAPLLLAAVPGRSVRPTSAWRGVARAGWGWRESRRPRTHAPHFFFLALQPQSLSPDLFSPLDLPPAGLAASLTPAPTPAAPPTALPLTLPWNRRAATPPPPLRTPPPPPAPPSTGGHPLSCDSVRRKRKHKMNKHKHRKRRKLVRHKSK